MIFQSSMETFLFFFLKIDEFLLQELNKLVAGGFIQQEKKENSQN